MSVPPVILTVDAVGDLAGEDLVGERVLHLALDDALQRPRAVDRVVALLGEPGPRRLVEVERDLAVVEELLQPLQLDVDDRRPSRSRFSRWKRMMSSSRLRNSGRKCAAHHAHHHVAHLVDVLVLAEVGEVARRRGSRS